MRIAVIGDRHTVLGFSLAGVEGTVPGDRPEETLKEFMGKEDLGVLIITAGIASELYRDIERYKRQQNFPIVVEIPEHGKEISEDSIGKLMKRAVGMDIKT